MQQNDQPELIDHLFRRSYAKHLAILVRLFGPSKLELLEDALQDTFAQAVHAWREQVPERPEAWLTTAAKHRAIDLLRRQTATQQRHQRASADRPLQATVEAFFLDHEVADAQLRMIFTACHPALKPQDQIAFALKCVSGFSGSEIAAALLLKPETVKKRLTRARAVIQHTDLQFEVPTGAALRERLPRVLEVLYLIFNEGYHSASKDTVVRQELCSEAMRACQLLLQSSAVDAADGAIHALLALMCFHASRLEAKVTSDGELVDLKRQDRTKWHMPLAYRGHSLMSLAVQTDSFSVYHYEAAIAAEHLRARSFAETNWTQIAVWYERLRVVAPSPMTDLSLAIVYIQNGNARKSRALMENLSPAVLASRGYLLLGCWAEWHKQFGQVEDARACLQEALAVVVNAQERAYLLKKLAAL